MSIKIYAEETGMFFFLSLINHIRVCVKSVHSLASPRTTIQVFVDKTNIEMFEMKHRQLG